MIYFAISIKWRETTKLLVVLLLYGRSNVDEIQFVCTVCKDVNLPKFFLHFKREPQGTLVTVNCRKIRKLCEVKFPITTASGLRLFRISINIFTTATCNYIIHIGITYHKGCLLLFMFQSLQTHPGKASRKLVYVLLFREYPWQ